MGRTGELFVSSVTEARVELDEQDDVTAPLTGTVSEISERVYREPNVLQAIDG